MQVWKCDWLFVVSMRPWAQDKQVSEMKEWMNQMNGMVEWRWCVNKVWLTVSDESRLIVKISVTFVFFIQYWNKPHEDERKKEWKRNKELALVLPWENSSPHLTLRESWTLAVVWSREAVALCSLVFAVTWSGLRIFSQFPLQPQFRLNLFGLRDHSLTGITCLLSGVRLSTGSAGAHGFNVFFLTFMTL